LYNLLFKTQYIVLFIFIFSINIRFGIDSTINSIIPKNIDAFLLKVCYNNLEVKKWRQQL